MSARDERQAEFVRIAGGQAASAVAKLVQCTAPLKPPRCAPTDVGKLLELLAAGPGECAAGVFADLSGPLVGRIGLLLSRAMVEEALRRLVHEDPRRGLSPRGYSALEELGNVALSAAAGAFGELAGGVELPSLPRLSPELTEARLRQELSPEGEPRAAYLAETELGGELSIRVVWLPREYTGRPSTVS